MDLTDKRVEVFMRALDALDPEMGRLVKGRWQDHAAAKRPLLVVFGPHNAGKTNLVKRLLIDERLPVPRGLRTGARPEDSSGETTEWGGWRILDLPGIGSELRQHDDTAWDGLELADAVLLVMPLKLLTGEGLKAREVVDGSWWSADGEPLPWPDGGLQVVIARVDAGAADPDDDPEELEELKLELWPAIEQLFEPVGGLGGARLHWTAASPNGLLSGSGQVEPADLDRFRAWDGMAELTENLRSAARRPEALRGAALVRFLHRAAQEVNAAAGRELAELRSRLDRAELVDLQRKLVDEHVAATTGSIDAKLTAVVVDCFASALDDPALGASPAAAMRRAFANKAEAFEATFVADVDALIDELRTSFEDLPDLEAGKRPVAPAGAARRTATPPKFDAKTASDSLRTLATEGVELRLGAPVKEVKRRLDTLENVKPEQFADALKKAGFGSADKAADVKRLISRFEKTSKALEAIPDAVKLIEVISDFRRGKGDQSRAEEAERQQDELVTDLVREMLEGRDGYRARLERLREMALRPFEGVSASSETLQSAVSDLERQVEALNVALADLRG